MKIFRQLRVAMGAWLCSRGHHASPLEWADANKRRVPITNQPMEMMMAGGFASFIQSNGFCTRCGRAVMWSSEGVSRRASGTGETESVSARSGRGASDG